MKYVTCDERYIKNGRWYFLIYLGENIKQYHHSLSLLHSPRDRIFHITRDLGGDIEIYHLFIYKQKEVDIYGQCKCDVYERVDARYAIKYSSRYKLRCLPRFCNIFFR